MFGQVKRDASQVGKSSSIVQVMTSNEADEHFQLTRNVFYQATLNQFDLSSSMKHLHTQEYGPIVVQTEESACESQAAQAKSPRHERYFGT